MKDSIRAMQSQIDSLLFKEGSFSAIGWLLSEGHLDYSDYQHWRKDGKAYLEDYFKTELPELITRLRRAEEYANKLKLESFHLSYYSALDQEPLRVCRSEANERLLTTGYQPARNRVQTDLFFDSAPLLLQQNLKRAIADQQSDLIPGLLMQLKSLAPEKSLAFEHLLLEQEQLRLCLNPGKRIETLQNRLTPTAFEVLGSLANDFLIPFWQQLSLDLSGRPFDPANPELHSSFTAFKALQWQQVIDAIAREENWPAQPLLLFRYAEACFKLNREVSGLEKWFKLFLDVPEYAERMLADTSNFLLRSDWRNFNELEPDLEARFFPAWAVLIKPALAVIEVDTDAENPACRALQMIRDLANSAQQGITEHTIQLRAKLRQDFPNLFVHYMAASASSKRARGTITKDS
ncbi:MAG: hypothetical protein ACU843_08420 [Gammaproteobacteria bacterium]